MVELQGHPTGARPRCRQRSVEKRPGALPGNRGCPQSEARRGQTVESHDVNHVLAAEAHFFLRGMFVAVRTAKTMKCEQSRICRCLHVEGKSFSRIFWSLITTNLHGCKP